MIKLENHRLATITSTIDLGMTQHEILKLVDESLRGNFLVSKYVPTKYLLVTKRNMIILH